jgi:hypothetical protein
VDIVFKHYGKPFLQHLIQSHQSWFWNSGREPKEWWRFIDREFHMAHQILLQGQRGFTKVIDVFLRLLVIENFLFSLLWVINTWQFLQLLTHTIQRRLHPKGIGLSLPPTYKGRV